MNLDDPVQLQKELLKRTYLLALFPLLFSLVSSNYRSLLGFILGVIISTLIFRLNALHIERALNMPQGRAEKFIRNRSLLNQLIYFVVLFVAYRNPEVNFIAAIIGLLLLKFTIIVSAIIDLIKDSWQKKIDSYKVLKDNDMKGGNI